jgi:plasmid stabilization system protein ParE
VAKERRRKILVTGPARRDIAAILKRSAQEFGIDASLRYQALIRQALLNIETDDERPGSKLRPDIMAEGARTYRISLSRARVIGAKVKEPTHFVLDRRRGEVIEVQ